MGGLLRWRRSIRAAGSLREVLSGAGHVDHHAHGILRAPPSTLDEFRGLFSESTDPRQWPHVATGVMYQRAIGVLAQHLDCEPTEGAVFERRLATDPREYASSMLQAAGAELLLVDDGFPPADVSINWEELGELARCPSRPVLRIERVAEDGVDAVRREVDTARERGFVALKTIAAYRGGLDLDRAGVREAVLAALEANEATGDPLPVQVHSGFGDADLFLPHADPGYLKPLIERFDATSFVLLHCYPFVREAGWLAHVYGNVHFDLSLTIPHVSRPGTALAEALELAPVSKLLYASDAATTPELYLLAAIWWRDALADVLPEALPAAAAEDAAHMILRENARALYRL
jgi:predicted TIM-barrel fold metal-dependent hydrolase